MYDIIVLAGQSNAEGLGFGDCDNPYVKDDRVLQMVDLQKAAFKDDGNGNSYLDVPMPCMPAVKAAEERRDGDSVYGNLALAFAREYISDGLLAEGRKILIVRSECGGTGFAPRHWCVGDPLANRMFYLTDAALALDDKSKIVAFLWHQGERDAIETESATVKRVRYKNELSKLWGEVRSKYSQFEFPIIAGEFVPEWYEKNREICDIIVNSTREVCAAVGNACVVKSDGLLSNNQKNGNGDDLHFCRDSSLELGKRYFDEYRRLLSRRSDQNTQNHSDR